MTDLSQVYMEEYYFTVHRYTSIVPLAEEDYFTIFKRGIRRMFVDTGRAKDFNSMDYSYETMADCPHDFAEDEIDYILTAAKIAFYEQMVNDVSQPNRIVKHTTDALTVQFSDKSTAELNGIIADLEARLREIYFKMTRFHRNDGRCYD